MGWRNRLIALFRGVPESAGNVGSVFRLAILNNFSLFPVGYEQLRTIAF